MKESHPLLSIFYTSTPLTTFTFTQAKHGFPLLFPFFILLLLLAFIHREGSVPPPVTGLWNQALSFLFYTHGRVVVALELFAEIEASILRAVLDLVVG